MFHLMISRSFIFFFFLSKSSISLFKVFSSFFYMTPLHAAAKVGQKQLVQLLIDSGANYNAQTQMVSFILLMVKLLFILQQ